MPVPRFIPRLTPKITGKVLARIAARYEGQGYVYGGNASRPGVWDCSSFGSYVLHAAGLGLPGPGKWGDPTYPPNSHGPVVEDYAAWAGAETISLPETGCLCLWVGAGPNGHMGIAVSADEMVSALNPTDGVARTAIAGTGPAGSPLVYRRVLGVPAGAGAIIPLPAGRPGGPKPAGLAVAVLAPLIVLGVFTVAAVVLAGVGGWAVRRAVA